MVNVLYGDMALVGPRPEVSKYIAHYKNDYQIILSIKPGITDYAAIKFKNEEEILAKAQDVEGTYINEIMPQKIKLYNEYIQNVSFLGDIKLILQTILPFSR